MKRLLIKVYGIVQGVGFRYFTLTKAKLLGINGYVRNLPDGSVFIDCEGDEDKLKMFIEYLKKGPRFASVERIEAKEAGFKGYTDFEVKR